MFFFKVEGKKELKEINKKKIQLINTCKIVGWIVDEKWNFNRSALYLVVGKIFYRIILKIKYKKELLIK